MSHIVFIHFSAAGFYYSAMGLLLPKEFFTRIHRSYIVALKHLETVKKHCVVNDAKEIPINSNYREGFVAIIDEMAKKRNNKT